MATDHLIMVGVVWMWAVGGLTIWAFVIEDLVRPRFWRVLLICATWPVSMPTVVALYAARQRTDKTSI